jgi:hypothetical protein
MKNKIKYLAIASVLSFSINAQSLKTKEVKADKQYEKFAYVNAIRAQNAILFANYAGNVQGQLNTGVLNQFTFNGSLLLDIPEQGTNRFITLIVYADGVQIYQADVLNQEPLRMPAAQKGYVYEMTISGNTPVRFVAMASSIGELRMIGN